MNAQPEYKANDVRNQNRHEAKSRIDSDTKRGRDEQQSNVNDHQSPQRDLEGAQTCGQREQKNYYVILFIHFFSQSIHLSLFLFIASTKLYSLKNK